MNDAAQRHDPVCWVVSDGKAGIEIQCRGLGQALGFDLVIKRIKVRRPWRWLPPAFWLDPLHAIDPSGDRLVAPWPDVLIGTGRQSVAPSLAIRRASQGRTFTIQVQNPQIDPAHFDLVVTPAHDRLRGENVIATQGSLHGLSEEGLAEAARGYGRRIAHLPRPLVAVLIGGDSRVHRMTPAFAKRFAGELATLAGRHGAGLLVTPSRRTGKAVERILQTGLEGSAAEIWDGRGENPYHAFLGLADYFVVTSDSVNLVCEAAFTGKPIYIADVEGGTAKFRRFHRSMREAGITRPFDGSLETWGYSPLDETRAAAAEIKRRMAAHAAQIARHSPSIDLSQARG